MMVVLIRDILKFSSGFGAQRKTNGRCFCLLAFCSDEFQHVESIEVSIGTHRWQVIPQVDCFSIAIQKEPMQRDYETIIAGATMLFNMMSAFGGLSI